MRKQERGIRRIRSLLQQTAQADAATGMTVSLMALALSAAAAASVPQRTREARVSERW